MKTKIQSIRKSPEYRALLKAKNAAAKLAKKDADTGRALLKEWIEVDRVNTILINSLVTVVKESSSVLRVIAKVNEDMKGMDVVQKCVAQCDSEAFQAESVLRVRKPAT